MQTKFEKIPAILTCYLMSVLFTIGHIFVCVDKRILKRIGDANILAVKTIKTLVNF